MRAELKLNISFEQLLSLVRQLPRKDKIRLTKELEKESIESKLAKILDTFKSDELSTEIIDEEVGIVRATINEKPLS